MSAPHGGVEGRGSCLLFFLRFFFYSRWWRSEGREIEIIEKTKRKRERSFVWGAGRGSAGNGGAVVDARDTS